MRARSGSRVAPSRQSHTRWPAALRVVGTVLLVTLLVHLAVLVVSGGPWTGPVSLRKPATFAETGWLACWSAALVLPVLDLRAWQEHVVGAATALFGLAETAVIGLQAWRGVPSHYNFTTPLDAALMRGGAAGTAAVFLVAVVVLLVAAVRDRGADASIRLGVLAGGAVLLVGCLVGLVMVFNNSGVYQGSVHLPARTAGYLGPDAATVGPEYVLIRPATAGGDLVLPHAIGVHGMVLLAVPAVLLARTTLAARRRLQLVAVAAAAVGVALTLLLGHALAQEPLRALTPFALAVLAACCATLAGVYAVVAHALVRRRTA